MPEFYFNFFADATVDKTYLSNELRVIYFHYVFGLQRKMRHLLDILRADLDSKDEKKLDLFVDYNFSFSRNVKDPFALPHAMKNRGLLSQDFTVGDYKSTNLRYPDRKDDGPQLNDNVQTGLDEEDNPGPSGSLTCFGERDLDHNNIPSGQEDFEATRQSPEEVLLLPEDERDTSQHKGDFLSSQDDHEETPSEDNTQLTEKMAPEDEDLLEDGNLRSFSQMGLTDPPELERDLRIAHELEDLEQSFSKIIQVSKAEECSVHEEETQNVPSDRENASDEDDF